MSRKCLIGLLSILLGNSGMALAHAEEGLKAGAAKVDITPPLGYALWGYSVRKDNPSTGIHDRLFARALVLATQEQRIAIVALDLGRAPTRTSVAAIRARVKEACGIEHFFLVASHTHSGPVLEVITWPTPERSYVRQLESQLVEVIVQAAKKLEPAHVGVISKTHSFNRNRHSRLPDAPVDRQMLVLRVATPGGKPIAHAVNLAAHPVMLNSRDCRFSADFPGAMASLVEKETGVPCLFLQGASGDLSPNPRKEQNHVTFGEQIGKEVLDLLKDLRCQPMKPNRLSVREDDFTFPCRVDISNPLVFTAFSSYFFPDLIAFYEREYREGVRPHLTTALLDNRIGFVGVSGEFFAGHALALRQRARLEHLFFLGYCNDYQQYFPTIEAAAQGGYGTDISTCSATIGAGERIMDRALMRLFQMRGRFPTDLPP